MKEKEHSTKQHSQKGITLVALVITIIVLLILAGITVTLLFSENGIVKKAERAKEGTGRAALIENARTDILAKQTDNSGKLYEKELEEILTPKYGTLSEEESSILDKTLTSKDGKYQIKVSEIWSGDFAKQELEGYYFYVNSTLVQWKSWEPNKTFSGYRPTELINFCYGLEAENPSLYKVQWVGGNAQPIMLLQLNPDGSSNNLFTFYSNNHLPPKGAQCSASPRISWSE